MRHDEITLREVYGRIDMDFENGFGDLPGDAEGELSVLRDTAASEQLREASLQLSHRDDQSKRTTRLLFASSCSFVKGIVPVCDRFSILQKFGIYFCFL